jgi:hypothetical protein
MVPGQARYIREGGCGTHLAVCQIRSIHADHVNDYCQKCGHTRQGVNLQQFCLRPLDGLRKYQKRRLLATDPYGPQVSLMPSDYIPFIAKGGDKLPSASKKWGFKLRGA